MLEGHAGALFDLDHIMMVGRATGAHVSRSVESLLPACSRFVTIRTAGVRTGCGVIV